MRYLSAFALISIIVCISLISLRDYDTLIIADGNSYVSGNGHIPFTDHLEKLSNVHVLNFGVGGQTTVQMQADATAQVFSEFSPGKRNVLIVMEGGNDIFFHGSVDSAFEHYKQYCLKAKKTGYIVVASTTIPRRQATDYGDNITCFNEKLKDFNQRLLADKTFYHLLIRPDADSSFKSFASAGYDPDGIHPSNFGQKRLAETLERSIFNN